MLGGVTSKAQKYISSFPDLTEEEEKALLESGTAIQPCYSS